MPVERIGTAFAALADPTRRAILARLARGEAAVCELARPFAMSLSAVSKHLGVMKRAGLISRKGAARWRRCRIRGAALLAASEWLEDVPARPTVEQNRPRNRGGRP